MLYVIAIITLIILVLFVPQIILVIGGIILLFVPSFEIVEIAAVIVGLIKLIISRK